tara:strand:- start:827 stop:1231 length:405 start_codon:yes stop_codon:yes gene_type:complete
MSIAFGKLGKGRNGMKRKGKGRRVKKGVMESGTMVPCAFQKENGLLKAAYGGWRKNRMKAVTRLQKRRDRRKTKKLAVCLKNENKQQQKDEEMKKEMLKKKHAKEVRILRQKFFRDIYNLWEKQAEEIKLLESV